MATNDDDSFLLMPETKWSTFVRNVDTACIRHLGRCLYEPSTNSCYPFPPTSMWVLFDQFLVETTSHDDIAKVTIVAPDSTTVTTRQSIMTRTSPGNMLPVREEVVSSGQPHRRSSEAHSNEGCSNEGHSNEGHSNEGCSNEGHSNEAHSSEGHSNEGHSNEGHIGVGSMEVFSTLGNDDDNELFCSAESSLEALQLSPASPATIQLSPASPATIQLSPASPATIQLSPTSPATIQLSPTSPTTIQLSPASPATIQLSPASPATIQLSPASPATIQSPPSQEQLYISHFCPSLNTLLTEVQGTEGVKERVQRAEGVKEGVQRADGVKEGVPYYNSMVYDFHDGPRVGVANNGTPWDALPSLSISLSNMDSIQWGKCGSKEVDGNDDASKTLQNEHTVGVEDRVREGTVADASLAGPDNHTLSDGHIPVEGHAPSEVHIPMEEHAGRAPSDDHSSDEQPEARSTKFKTPPPKQEDHPQILYRPSISSATPSRLLSLSQDLGMVTWARERGGQAGTTETSTRVPPSSSHASAQSEKVWKRLLGHTQSSERRVRQKYQPGTKKQEKVGLEGADGQVCEGAVCEDIGTENGCDPRLEEGGGDGMDQVSEARCRGSDGDHGDMSRPHSGSGDQVVACAASEHQTATDDLGCLRTNSAPLASQPEAVLEGGEPCTQGSSGSPDPFASIPLPSCDPQLSEGLLLPLMGPGESLPLVTRRCWDSSEPHRPDYGPPSLDLNTAVFENISCEHDEMCQVLAVRHQVLVDLKGKVRTDPSSIPQEVLGHALSGECDRSLLPTILEALNLSITNTWDMGLSISVLPLAAELISEQADPRHVVVGCNSVLRVIDCHLHDLHLSNSEDPSDPVVECLHHLKRVHLAIQALLPRLQEHGETDALTDAALSKLLVVRDSLNLVLRKPQVQ
ncbi:hypothetical protein EMCRGX_G027850 [Ephydatia muelleri]